MNGIVHILQMQEIIFFNYLFVNRVVSNLVSYSGAGLQLPIRNQRPRLRRDWGYTIFIRRKPVSIYLVFI